jgi:hypothetical protein
MIAGFRRKLEEICALLGYYAAYDGNSLPMFLNNLSVLSSRNKTLSAAVTVIRIREFMDRKFGYWNNRLYRGFGKELRPSAAYYLRRTKSSDMTKIVVAFGNYSKRA